MSSLESDRARPDLADIVKALSSVPMDGHGVWVAYSGGLDSTVLLHGLATVLSSQNLRAIHINHQLSPNAEAWQEHCQGEASKLGIPLITRKVKLAEENLEAAGRRARLSVFEEIVGEGDIVVTAHHADDESESLLWQLATGRAMTGIQQWVDYRQYRLWRPLLAFSREGLRHVASSEGWQWIEDESNQDIDYTRNFLRHRILPEMRARFDNFDSHLRRQRVDQLTGQYHDTLSIKDPVPTTASLREWLYGFGVLATDRQLKEIVRQISSASSKRVRVDLSDDWVVCSDNEALYLISA